MDSFSLLSGLWDVAALWDLFPNVAGLGLASIPMFCSTPGKKEKTHPVAKSIPFETKEDIGQSRLYTVIGSENGRIIAYRPRTRADCSK